MRTCVSSVIAFGLLMLDGALRGAIVTRGPFLQAVGQNRITICWRTDVETTTEVRYGTALQGSMVSEQVSGTRTEHVVNLVGLVPSTRYFYSVHGTPVGGAEIQVGGANHWFRTVPMNLDTEVARFWVVGDSGYQFAGPVENYNAYMAQTAEAHKRTDGFLMLGDNAYDVGSDSQIQAAVFNRYTALLRNTPLWSAFGNHDGYSVPYPHEGVTPYDSSFYFPIAGQCGGIASGTKRYYSFDHGDIHFICLDTFTPVNAFDVPGDPQGMVDWLRADLQSCGAQWIVAFMHYGPYSKGTHDSDTEGTHVRAHVVPLLEQYGADLVLAGHSHAYERSRLIDGHYGNAATWNAVTMLKQDGNGSKLGGVTTAGDFQMGLGTGVYQKPAATGRAGTVYLVCGASSAQQGWWGGSTALVATNPHPVHVTNLNLVGSVVLEVGRNRLNGRYLDQAGATRDDFTLVKGSTYDMRLMSPAFPAPNVPGASFVISRSGTFYAEDVSFTFEDAAGNPVTPGAFSLPFAAGQTFATVSLAPPAGAPPGNRYKLKINPVVRPVVTGGTPREAYGTMVSSREVEFATTPARSWYATWFPGQVPTNSDWQADIDSDGRSNILEYAFGGDPTLSDAVVGYELAIEGGNIVLRFVRPYGRSDLTYHVEESYDMKAWTRSNGTLVSDGPATAAGELYRTEIPMLESIGFLRLAVELTGG